MRESAALRSVRESAARGTSRPRPASRAALLACAASVLAFAGCSVKAQPVHAVGLNRATPRATYEYMLAMVRAMQVEAEWAAFSPGFKRRLSESAGRNVDFGDYSHARATIAGNDRREMRLFLESEYVGETAVSDKEVTITVRAGSQQLRPRLVKLSTWELTLSGENQPVSGFVPRTADVVGITPDGNVQVRVTPEQNTQSFLREIPADRIESMTVKSEWFVDDFGGIEEAVRTGLGGVAGGRAAPGPASGPRAAGPPPQPTPREPPPMYGPPPPAYGNPPPGYAPPPDWRGTASPSAADALPPYRDPRRGPPTPPPAPGGTPGSPDG